MRQIGVTLLTKDKSEKALKTKYGHQKCYPLYLESAPH
jgi:hypothetical protein